MQVKKALLGLMFIFLTVPALGEAPRCGGVFTASTVLTTMESRLLRDTALYTQNLTTKDVRRENRELLEQLALDMPPESSSRRLGISGKEAERVVSAVLRSPFLGADPVKYQRKETQIGYCFGRATFVHLLLLKLGVQKESIRKIWIVGPMQVPGTKILWDYHVASMVYSKEAGTWLVLDSNLYRPVTAEQWVSDFMAYSVDGRAKVYITEAQKFAPDLGKYDRVQLGLKLSKDQDWYQGYFSDMMTYFKTHNLKDIGVE